MVATTGTIDVVDFVLGKQQVAPSDLTPEAWVKIIRATLADLPLKWVRGFKPPKAMLASQVGLGIERIVGSEVIRRAVELGMRPNAVFLEIGDMRNTVPRSWDDAPREKVKKPIEAEGFDGLEFDEDVLTPVETIKLVVSREGRFYILRALWEPHEKWDDNSMSSRPLHFWYEAAEVVLLELAGDDALIPLLQAGREAGNNRIEHQILWRFYQILNETKNHLW